MSKHVNDTTTKKLARRARAIIGQKITLVCKWKSHVYKLCKSVKWECCVSWVKLNFAAFQRRHQLLKWSESWYWRTERNHNSLIVIHFILLFQMSQITTYFFQLPQFSMCFVYIMTTFVYFSAALPCVF